MFDRDSAMLLHLERGTCPSGIDVCNVEGYARECRQWKQYASTDEDREFCCPGCKTPFSRMSGVLQHDESGFCPSPDGNASLAKFMRYLRLQVEAGC